MPAASWVDWDLGPKFCKIKDREEVPRANKPKWVLWSTELKRGGMNIGVHESRIVDQSCLA